MVAAGDHQDDEQAGQAGPHQMTSSQQPAYGLRPALSPRPEYPEREGMALAAETGTGANRTAGVGRGGYSRTRRMGDGGGSGR